MERGARPVVSVTPSLLSKGRLVHSNTFILWSGSLLMLTSWGWRWMTFAMLNVRHDPGMTQFLILTLWPRRRCDIFVPDFIAVVSWLTSCFQLCYRIFPPCRIHVYPICESGWWVYVGESEKGKERHGDKHTSARSFICLLFFSLFFLIKWDLCMCVRVHTRPQERIYLSTCQLLWNLFQLLLSSPCQWLGPKKV